MCVPNDKRKIEQKSASDQHSCSQFQPRFALYSSDKKVPRVHVHLCLKPSGAPYDPYCAPGDSQISTLYLRTETYYIQNCILQQFAAGCCWLVGLIVTYGLAALLSHSSYLRAGIGFPTTKVKPWKYNLRIEFHHYKAKKIRKTHTHTLNTGLERWSIFCGDGMVMALFSQRWNVNGF